MAGWLIHRILIVILSAFAAMTIVFWLNFLIPGDASAAAFAQSSADDRALDQWRTEHGLDRPPINQYFRYVSSVVQLDFGRSWATDQSVTILVASQIGPTFMLAFTSIVLAIILGLGGSLISFAGGWPLKILDTVSVLTLSVPIIFTGTLAIWVLAIRFDWFPATGQGRVEHLVLPSLVLGLNGSGSIYRIARTALVESMTQPWVMAARARGLSRARMWLRYIVRPAILPILNVIGLQFGYLLGGVAVVETLFARSGLGRTLVSGVVNKDLPVVLSIVLVVALSYGLLNLCVDALYLGLDPRLRTRLYE